MASDPVSAAVAFGAGLISFFAPCVLPVIPGYLAFVTGGSQASARRRIALTVAFVAGFTIAFTLIGLAVGTVGSSAAFRSAETWLQRVGGALIIVFGLYMTGLLKLGVLDREVRFHGKAPARFGAIGGALFLGAAFGVGWSPCVGPVFASILVLAGVGGGAAQGALLLALYSAGLAVPFLVLGITADRGAAFLRKHASVARSVEVVGGVILILLGIFVFTGSLARFTSYLGIASPF